MVFCVLVAAPTLLSGPRPRESPHLPTPSAASTFVVEFGQGAEPLRIRVVDWSGTLASARSPTDRELGMAFITDNNIVVVNPQGDLNQLLLVWMGSFCDVGAELSIDSDPRVIVLKQDPRESCDSAGVGKGALLVFSRPVPAASVRATIVRFPPR